MKIRILTTLLSSALISLAAPEAIFDGKTLEGWEVKGAPVWTVTDGAIIGHNGPGKKGSILWTKEEFTDFVFETKFHFEGRIDSGVFLRHENDQIQMGISGSLKRDMTASPYIASKRGYPAEAEGATKLLKEGEWNSMRITAKGNVYTVELNGKEVMKYTSDTARKTGPIGLQVHGGIDMKIAFKDLTLEEL
jgi:hypothetical protein